MEQDDDVGAVSVPTDSGRDWVVREEPLLIEVGDDAVLTMRTPGHDADLALGFLLGEGIVARASDVAAIELCPRGSEPPRANVDVARVWLAPGVALGAVARTKLSRAHAIRPSCGVCGLTSADALAAGAPPLAAGAPRIEVAALSRLVDALLTAQPTFRRTGGCHATGLFDAATHELWAAREDVGRHNALDKALGRCAADGRDLSRAVAVLSGRGGFELVLKALRLGVPIVASVSAPSSLAVELAVERGLTLVGFVRDGGGRVYADDGRIAWPRVGSGSGGHGAPPWPRPAG